MNKDMWREAEKIRLEAHVALRLQEAANAAALRVERLRNEFLDEFELRRFGPDTSVFFLRSDLLHLIDRRTNETHAVKKRASEERDETLQWKDISTAPKDGTKILVCRAIDADGDPTGDARGLFTQRAAWWADEDGKGGEWVVYCSLPEEPRLFFEPTHWMPIPPPPKT